MPRNLLSIYLGSLVGGLVLSYLFKNDFWSVTGLIFSGFIFYRTFRLIGKTLPIAEFIILLMLFQWFLAPYFDYIEGVAHYRYYMRVPQSVYMAFTVPAILMFSFFLSVFANPISFQKLNPEKVWLKLLLLGLAGFILYSFVPASLRFVFFLLQGFVFVAALIKYYNTEDKNRFWLLGMALLWLLYNAFTSGFFHSALLWFLFIAPFVFKREKLGGSSKIVSIIGLFFLIIFIQFIKSPLRLALQHGDNPVTIILNTEFNLKQLFSNADELDALNARFNQGWIISTIISEVPDKIAFGNGETIWDAFQASFLPRFLMPNKKVAGGRENFEKFTGLQLNKGTSMGISVLGESYANFGKYGGIIFMGLWGLFLGWVVHKLSKIGKRNAYMVYFIPILFLQVVKAETELVVVLNHLVKASVLIWALIQVFNLKSETNQSKLASTSPA